MSKSDVSKLCSFKVVFGKGLEKKEYADNVTDLIDVKKYIYIYCIKKIKKKS
jgi:hypothetical protein